MKKVLQYLLIVAISATVALAGIKPDLTPAPQSKDHFNLKKMADDAINDVQIYDQNLLPTGGGLKSIDGGVYINAGSTNLFNMSPMVYEPKSGYIFMVNPVRYVPQGATLQNGRMDIHYSTDKGATWDTYTLHEMEFGFWGYASLAVMNPTGSTNIEDMRIYVFAVRWEYDEMTQETEFVGMQYLIQDKSIQSTIIDDIIERGPTSNNSGFEWNFVKTAYYDGPNKQTVLNYGTLDPDEFSQYGVYGVGYWTFGNNGSVEYGSSCPIGWDIKQFRPSTGLGVTYNSAPEIDFDPEGNAYCAVFNMSADNIDKRVPAISISDNDGRTWSEFEFMPVSVLQDFYVANGGILVNSEGNAVTWSPGLMAYGTYGFAVTDVNEYSYVFRFVVYTSDTTSIPMIVEASKKDDVWSVRKVADMNYTSYFYFAYFDADGNATASSLYGLPLLRDSGSEPWRDSLYANPRDLELQLSKTVDNQLMVKFLDVPSANEANIIDPPHILNGGNNIVIGEDTWPAPLAEIHNDDIFIGYRNVDGGDWSVSNVTQNNIYYKQTWIPAIVPSINEVPLITSRTVRPTTSTSGVVDYPENLLWYYAGGFARQQAMFAMVDPTDGQPIDDFVNSVEVSDQVSFDIKSIYPNPTSNTAEVVFNTNTYGEVLIALYDAQGNKVQNVTNTTLAAGSHVVTIKNLNSLSSGTYYVTMTFNGVVISKPLNVVK